jgi:hypothetical protein
VSLCGRVDYQRSYYYCRRCGRGLSPFDEQAGISSHRLSPAAEQVTALAGGVADSFEKAAELLQEMAGLSVAESTAERATEDVGLDIAARLQQGAVFGRASCWRWRRDAHGRCVAYVSIDATGTRQQGPGGARAEGRMAYVAAVFNPPEVEWLRRKGQTSPPVQARYLSGLYELAAMGPLLRRQAAQVGMEGAEVWVALTDGGNGLEQFVQSNFNRPDLVVILDFYHAASYLEKLAKATLPQQEEAAQALAEQWCGLLKAEGGATMLAVLRQWEWPKRRGAEWRKQWEATQEYFANNVHRMEYPEYLAEGWHIGSGVVESACKTVVGQRLKGAGMRWGEAGAHGVCHVRALYRSEKGQWQAYWRGRAAKCSPVQQLK